MPFFYQLIIEQIVSLCIPFQYWFDSECCSAAWVTLNCENNVGESGAAVCWVYFLKSGFITRHKRKYDLHFYAGTKIHKWKLVLCGTQDYLSLNINSMCLDQLSCEKSKFSSTTIFWSPDTSREAVSVWAARFVWQIKLV